jgi:hypothetical protein
MLVPLNIPPGVYSNGTEYQSKGRNFDANLVRWQFGALGPIGGWRKRTEYTEATNSYATVTGKARRVISWRDNNSQAWSAIGTHSNLYAMTISGVLSDITPTGLTVGRADATTGAGYGSGGFGEGPFGQSNPEAYTTLLPASIWSLDTFGEILLGVLPDDGKLYEWNLNTNVVATQVTNAPISNKCVLVTPERIVMCLGAAGVPRDIAWSDQEDRNEWTAAANNQAGNFSLQTAGTILNAVNVKGGSLIFTDKDVWRVVYLGPPLVYGFPQDNAGGGLVSAGAVTTADGAAYWMSHENFYVYTGYSQPIACDVHDAVFKDINRAQISKVTAWHNASFGEVWWFYPSADSTENDKYVVYDYRERHWNKGTLSRLCATDKAPLPYPIAVDAYGYVYDHEVGYNHDGAISFIEHGPVELGTGENSSNLTFLYPDESAQGDVSMTFKTKMYPNGTERSFGPYTATRQPVPIRVHGRQMLVKAIGAASTNWRLGIPRIEVKPGSKR